MKFIYLCGPTVYNKVHIGNMRPIVTFDIMIKALNFLEPSNICFIHNITDIDDKIIAQAKKENLTEEEISKKYLNFYIKMLNCFNVNTIDKMPLVTQNINEIELFIKELINKKKAYEIDSGIYFDVSISPIYNKLSKNELSNLLNIKDNDNVLNKKNFFDFALWKKTNEGIQWEILNIKGRPGWHTECASFINYYTKGESLYIHGGGVDLKFPHHENENAQFFALNNKEITKNWFHLGTINYEGQKMSKSLGNIIYADDFIKQFENELLANDLFRLLILSTNPFQSINLNSLLIAQLQKKINQIEKICLFVYLNQKEKTVFDLNTFKPLFDDLAKGKFNSTNLKINELIKEFNTFKTMEIAICLFNLLKFLGFNCIYRKVEINDIKIYNQWNKLKEQKDFTKADQLRVILQNKKLI